LLLQVADVKGIALPDADGHLHALRLLNSVSRRVHASLDLTETLDAVAQGVVEAAGFGLAVVNLAEPDGGFVAVAAAGSEQLRREMIGVRGSAESYRDLVGRAVRWDGLYFVDHRQGVPDSLYTFVPNIPEPVHPDGWHPLDVLLAPLVTASDEWLGVISVDVPVSGRLPGPLQREVLALFAEHASIAILHARMHTALERSQAQMQYAATHDALTGLANRAYLRGRVDELLQQPGREVGVLVIDLDGFKRVNDAAGHEAGDEVLRVVADRMRRLIRETDVLARMGGDEFVVVLAGNDVGGVLQDLAARLRHVIAEPIRSRAGVFQVGASVGCAVGAIGDDFSRVVAAADAAMYQSKHAHHRALSVGGV
jgi:diguanylate cyclase (GGDEF)-like protein